MDESYHYLFKIAVVGDVNVGKSSILNQFCYKTFHNKPLSTIGVDFAVYNLSIKTSKSQQVNVKLELWDTAGEERFKGLTSVFYRNADAILLVFDLTRRKTFESVPEWLQLVQNFCGDETHKILVANKSDLKPDIHYTEIEDFSYLHNISCVETSAKNCVNIEETFRKVAEDLIEKKDQLLYLPSLDSGPESIFLHYDPVAPDSKFCCSYI